MAIKDNKCQPYRIYLKGTREWVEVTTIADSVNTSSKINYYDSATATGKNGNTY